MYYEALKERSPTLKENYFPYFVFVSIFLSSILFSATCLMFMNHTKLNRLLKELIQKKGKTISSMDLTLLASVVTID